VEEAIKADGTVTILGRGKLLLEVLNAGGAAGDEGEILNTKNIGVRMLRAASSKPSELSTRLLIARWAPIPLRLIVGYGFIEHGFSKLSKGPDAFATILQGIGVPGPHFMAWLTILVELLGWSGSNSGRLSSPGQLSDGGDAPDGYV
jgi:hypothetical protein